MQGNRPPEPPRGRGATANPAGRFERRSVEASWDDLGDAADAPGPRTEVFVDASRTVIARNDSPDIPFDQSINPYRGCEHGCAYCFARPSHAFLGLSPGLDFETKIFSKPDAPELLGRELDRPGYRCTPLALGTNTDPYQPVERRHGITRRILEVLLARSHPFTLVTKSALILRDLDLIAQAASRGLTAAYFSITTLDPGLAGELEPRAAAPARRLDALRALADAGVPCGVLAAPMIPGLNDHELERILEAARGAGADTAGWILVRLPHELKAIFEGWLRAHRPSHADKVLGRLRDARGGALNDPRFGTRMRGEGPYARLLARRFEVAVRRLGFSKERPQLDTASFRPCGARKLFD